MPPIHKGQQIEKLTLSTNPRIEGVQDIATALEPDGILHLTLNLGLSPDHSALQSTWRWYSL